MRLDPDRVYQLLTIGAGPTGVAIGAAARRADLDVLVVDQGPALASLLQFPTHMRFFTTTDLLEIADIPFTNPEPKPSRRQAIIYYQSVIRRYGIPIAPHIKVLRASRGGDGIFTIEAEREGQVLELRARNVAAAMGYFDFPRRLGVEGEDLPWVHHRYREPYPHYGERVLVVGGGNSAAETAIELWRAGAEVVVVHRGAALKNSVKYWLKPDFENRVAEGAFEARYQTTVQSFEGGGTVLLADSDGVSSLEVDAVYVLIGYEPEMQLFEDAGVVVDRDTLVPQVDAETCESNVPGFYIAGSLQAGLDTNRIFIENSRDHALRIVAAVRLGLSD